MRLIAGIAFLSRVMTGIAAAAVLVMMLATSWDVFARTALNRPLHGVVEIVEVMVLLVAVLGLPQVFLRDENIQVDLADHLLSNTVLRPIRLVSFVLSLLFLVLMAWNLIPPMTDAYRFGDIKPDLMIPLYPLYATILISVAASILAATAAVLHEFGWEIPR